MSILTRRNLLQAGAAVAASIALRGAASAQAAQRGATSAKPVARKATHAPTPPFKFSLDAYSRNLQWCRTPQDLAKAVLDLGMNSIDLTVGGPDAHVALEDVKIGLPVFANGLKSAGVSVRCITVPFSEPDAAGVDATLAAASGLGIGYYTWSGLSYEAGKPMAVQTDAFKRRFSKFAQINEKYHIKGLYQPKQGMVGSFFFDLLPVMQALDPRFVAFRYDTAALLQPVAQNAVTQLIMGAPYIGGVALNDARVTLDLPAWRQGAFDDDPKMLTLPNGGGDNTGNAGGSVEAYGGGGNPLPYKYHPVPTGNGMVNLTLIGKALKDINFNGPAEVQVQYMLGGAETGSREITYPRQEVIGRIKRDRIVVEHSFEAPWGLTVSKPPFMMPKVPGAPPTGRRPGAGGAPSPSGAPEPNI